MRLALLLLFLATSPFASLATSAFAQATAPDGNGGGAARPSVGEPKLPDRATPPGTPGGETTGDRALRNAAGDNALGKTETPVTPVPGETGGVRKPD